MSYASQDAREDLLATLAAATERLGAALTALGATYEQLDEHTADRLEDELFRPVQVAYGRARRTHSTFAERHGLPGRAFAPPEPGAPSHGVHGFLAEAIDAITAADETLAELQDSMMPVEVGDPELRAGLAEVRELIGALPERAHALERVIGR